MTCLPPVAAFTRALWKLMVSAACVLVAVALTAPQTLAGTVRTYIVLYADNAVPPNSQANIQQSGGEVVASYPAIGVIIARSANELFASNLLNDGRIEGVAATDSFAARLLDEAADNDATALTPVMPAAGSDTLSSLQWDMVQIRVPEAHAINAGSPSVTVGVIDTGIDYTHPDLADNVDFSNSVSCIGGVPNTTPAAWADDNGHGTHIAGVIAAARNGIGIVGVAPNVKIAAIKTGTAAGFFFPEAVVCAYMWAGSHHLPVTNNSYFADPWQFNCLNDAGQRAIWKAEQRAIRYAIQQGVIIIAPVGNMADDLAHPTQDVFSPTDADPVAREITRACRIVPLEVPGVIGVAANGNKGFKAFYSSYGVGITQVTAPGGDSRLQVTPAATDGRVLSSWPAALFLTTCFAPRRVVDPSGATYCYMQGTSVSAPHATGVAALIVSTGVTSPEAVAAKLINTADPLDCPADTSIYDFFPSIDNGAPQVCQGGRGYNGFNGHGQVNALTAVMN